MNFSAAEGTYRSDDMIIFDDPLVDALLSTYPLKRLAKIGFLGAIDYARHGNGRSPHRRRHNRLEHSLGVARLADIYARAIELPEQRRRVLIAAALLHDIGHGPLSHSLESVFEVEFGINHHIMTRRILCGESPLGSEIRDVLADENIDIDEVVALIEGKHDGDIGFLFSGQINLDTLDGITRCRAFVARRSACRPPHFIVQRWAKAGRLPLSDCDEFWSLKNDVYNLLIGAPRGAALDGIAQAYMNFNLSTFLRDDYFLTEPQFRLRHRGLFKYLDSASKPWAALREQVPTQWMRHDITIKRRTFSVYSNVKLSSHESINERYRQTKHIVGLELGELTGND